MQQPPKMLSRLPVSANSRTLRSTDLPMLASLPRKAYRRAAVGLAYGRHAGPAASDARRAAVLIMLTWDGSQWNIPLTKRPGSLRHHGGQICLPGGRLEPGETAVEAAVREFEEELGVIPSDLHIAGQLSEIHVYASHNVVTPVVAMSHETMEFLPDPAEVEQAILLPWNRLANEGCWETLTMQRPIIRNQQVVDTFQFHYRALRFGEHRIWGATAMILSDIASRLASSRFRASQDRWHTTIVDGVCHV
ncbi:MAG: CoA pyrophosphatase [Pirellulaceae bacterium]